MLDVNRGRFLSLIYRQMYSQDDFSISILILTLSFQIFLDSKRLGNVIIFGAGRIAVENLT